MVKLQFTLRQDRADTHMVRKVKLIWPDGSTRETSRQKDWPRGNPELLAAFFARYKLASIEMPASAFMLREEKHQNRLAEKLKNLRDNSAGTSDHWLHILLGDKHDLQELVKIHGKKGEVIAEAPAGQYSPDDVVFVWQGAEVQDPSHLRALLQELGEEAPPPALRLPQSVDRQDSNSLGFWLMSPPLSQQTPESAWTQAISGGVEKLRQHSRDLALGEARQRMMHIMGALTERFGATSSWLFLRAPHGRSDFPWIDPDSQMTLQFSHNTGCRELKLGVHDAPSIVAHVAKTRRPYLTNDVEHEAIYLRVVHSTRSEIAVPIMVADDRGREQLLGVFNVESNRSDAFVACQQGELMSAASRLAPEILILDHLIADDESFGWHPATHGWTMERLLNAFCAAVAGTLDAASPNHPGPPADALPRPSCAIWYRDPHEPVLHVLATARFDYEYVNARVLPLDSFTGRIAESARGSVGGGCPTNMEPFVRPGKALDMGMVYAFAAPIHRPAGLGDGHAIGTVNLYFFKEELPQAMQEHLPLLRQRVPLNIVAQLAQKIGVLIHDCQQLRTRVAAAYLRYRLRENALAGLTDFDTIKQVALECLEAHGCSLFGLDTSRCTPDALGQASPQSPQPSPGRRILRCLATTGLCRLDGTPIDQSDVSFDLDQSSDRGLTVFLAENVGRAIRCRSTVGRTTWPASCGGPVNKYRETYSHAESEHRPYLGMSVDDGKNSPISVIRVLRRSGSTPFTADDELVLRRLVDECYPLFRCSSLTPPPRGDHEVMCAARYPFVVRASGRPATTSTLSVMERLGSEFAPCTLWNRRYVDSLLLDLMSIFGSRGPRNPRQGALVAAVRVLNTIRPPRYSIYARHAVSPDVSVSVADLPKDADESGNGTWPMPETHSVVTFSKKSHLYAPAFWSDQMTSAAAMPLRFLSRSGVGWGFLSLECDHLEYMDWRGEHLEALAIAAKKLDFLGRDNCLTDDAIYHCATWRRALHEFLTRSLAAVDVKCCNIVDENDRRLLEWHQSAAKDLNDVEQASIEQVWPEISDITVTSDPRGFKMDLWYGAFKTQLKLVGRLDETSFAGLAPEDLAETMRLRMTDISHLWNRFVSSRVAMGVKPLFKLAFRQDDARNSRLNETQFWAPDLTLGPDIFRQGAIPASSGRAE